MRVIKSVMAGVKSKSLQKRADALKRMSDLLNAGTLAQQPTMDDLATASGASTRTLHRQYGSLEGLLRAVHLERFAHHALPPIITLTGATQLQDDGSLAALIDRAVEQLFAPESRQARRIRANVLAAALYDPALAESVAMLLDTEHDALSKALQHLRKRGLLSSQQDPHDIAHVLATLSFGQLSFDLFPARSSWKDAAYSQRLLWHLLLRGRAPERATPSSEPPTQVATNASPPPAAPSDKRAEVLLSAAVKAINERGEANVQLRDLLQATNLDAHACYRWFGGVQALFDAAHARLMLMIDEPDAERFTLKGRMTPKKVEDHLRQATAEVYSPHRKHSRKRRIARLGITLGRPELEEVAAYGNVVLVQRLIALYERWDQEAELAVNPIASAYSAIVLSEGFGYLDFYRGSLPGPSAVALIEWVSGYFSRVRPHHRAVVPSYLDPEYARHRDELTAMLHVEVSPALPEAPRRRHHVTADQILQLALQALAEEGIGALQLSEVARRAGMSTANLIYYFPTRDLLLGSITAQLLEAQSERWKAMLDGIPLTDPGRAAKLIEATLKLATEPHEAATIRHLSALEASFPPVIAARQRMMDDWLDHQLLHFGAGPDHLDARTLLKLLHTLADGAASQHAERLAQRERTRTLIEPSVSLLAPSLQAALEGRPVDLKAPTRAQANGNRGRTLT